MFTLTTFPPAGRFIKKRSTHPDPLNRFHVSLMGPGQLKNINLYLSGNSQPSPPPLH